MLRCVESRFVNNRSAFVPILPLKNTNKIFMEIMNVRLQSQLYWLMPKSSLQSESHIYPETTQLHVATPDYPKLGWSG